MGRQPGDRARQEREEGRGVRTSRQAEPCLLIFKLTSREPDASLWTTGVIPQLLVPPLALPGSVAGTAATAAAVVVVGLETDTILDR